MAGSRRGISETRSDRGRHNGRRSKSRSPSRGGRRSKSSNPSRGRRFKSRSRGTKNAPEDYFSKRMNKDIETSQSASASSTISFEERVNDPINSHPNRQGNINRSLGDKYSWKTYEKFLESFISGLLKKLSEKDITLSREIYRRDPVNIKGLEKRLKHLSKKENPTLEAGLEMAYGAYKLNDLTKEKKILKAGKEAHKAAALFLQAEILREEGEKLLGSSQSRLLNAPRERKKK
ncbi:hypothetical protein L6164_002242 [Bauhinia variegata]|uniref:Uncharacterized protein n=1 Tax=Bauhinia variegata TaxID=167791 RepID=A0ACB9PY49_BAUVA|nr:hypothetical protein L6164_002242 [Bauhinia variegata]